VHGLGSSSVENLLKEPNPVTDMEIISLDGSTLNCPLSSRADSQSGHRDQQTRYY